jgi:hypothetical protein
MNSMFQVMIITIIVILIYAVYAAWFKDLGKRQWEQGGRNLPFMPDDQRTFIIVFRVLVTLTLLSFIMYYILSLTGAIQ